MSETFNKSDRWPELIDGFYTSLAVSTEKGPCPISSIPVITSDFVPENKVFLMSTKNGTPAKMLAVIEVGPAFHSTSELLQELWRRGSAWAKWWKR